MSRTIMGDQLTRKRKGGLIRLCKGYNPQLGRVLLMKYWLMVLALLGAAGAHAQTLRFEVSFPAAVSAKALDGHVVLAISKDAKEEPRFGIDEIEAKSQQAFSVDVEGLAPGAAAVIDERSLGYPVKSLRDLPAGDYTVQAVLNVYETFHRGDGKVVKLPPEMGEGQQWNKKPGNLFSKPQGMHIDAAHGGVVRISLTEKIPPIPAAKDTKYVKHFTFESKLLTQFWGRPTSMGAIVVLPEGFDEHANAHYPLLVMQGHFPADFESFRMEPPTAGMKGRELAMAQSRYKLFQDWISGRLPHVILLEIQHANPYYDDSYAVNSANVGPYGDAIVKELIPEVERRYRGIGQPWARMLAGGSTGGWETIADQVFYPDDFNGAWGWCPDPVDFHAYQSVNIYDDKNAFWDDGPWGRVPRTEMRDTKGNVLAEMSRRCGARRCWAPTGAARSSSRYGRRCSVRWERTGYPAPIWDPATGVIDAKVAEYWKQHYDLTAIMERDWATLGPKLVGKLHITVGDMDTWYLNNAVHRMQDFLDSPANPYKVADFDYGYGQPHCYTGGGTSEEAKFSTYQRLLMQVGERLKKSAPKGADVSWEY